uniref:Uncharacterized protein n=1 Tax=Rhizophora mucronata TaxID=61149 RepID=A0A2P2LUP3_RHIMU
MDWAVKGGPWHKSSQEQPQLLQSRSFHPPTQPKCITEIKIQQKYK